MKKAKNKKRKPGRRPGGKTAKLTDAQVLEAAKLVYTQRKKQRVVATKYKLSQSYFHAQLRDAFKRGVFSIDVKKGKGFNKSAA